MKVAVLTTVFPRWAGDYFGNYIYHVAAVHTQAGAEVRVVAPHTAGASTQERIDGVEVYRFRYALPPSMQVIAYGGGVVTELDRSLRAKLLLPFFCLSFLLRSIGIVRWADVVHAHWTLAGVIGLSLARLFRKHSVLTVYGIEVFTGRFSFLTKLCLRWADHVICISTATEQQMRTRFGQKIPNRSSVIPYGVPQAFLNSVDAQFDVRERHKLPDNALIVLSVGRLIERKGIEYLLRAAPLVLKATSTHFLIAGDGPDRPRLERLTAELGLRDAVTFAGTIPPDDLPSYYAQSDVFVHPVIADPSGDVEGLGIVLLEAMALGKPVIASGIGGITDVVADSETGYLLPEKDVDGLAEHVATLISDPGLRERMGEAGRRRVEERFSVPALADQVMQVYEGGTAREREAVR